MKYKFVLGPIAFILLGVSMTYAQSSSEPGSKPFHFSKEYQR